MHVSIPSCLPTPHVMPPTPGVTANKGKWLAKTSHKGKTLTLGYYVEEAAAARVVDQALLALRGPTTRTNFSVSDYSREEVADTAARHRLELHPAWRPQDGAA